MQPQVLLLLAIAAAMHAVWNLLSKRSIDKQVFLWLALLSTSVLFFVPFLFFYSPFSLTGWLFILLSAALEAANYLLAGAAYQVGDLSLVYPLSRGSAPLFVVLFAWGFLGESVALLGLLGIVLIVLGIYTTHIRSLSASGIVLPIKSLRERPSVLALLTGLSIAGYSVLDKVGVTYVSTVVYAYLIFLIAAIMVAPYMLLVKGSPVIRREWHANWRSVIVVSAMLATTYGIVLFAFTSTKVSYVSSVREMSVVFAALLGTLVLREPFGAAKVTGSVLIFAGIVLICLSH